MVESNEVDVGAVELEVEDDNYSESQIEVEEGVQCKIQKYVIETKNESDKPKDATRQVNNSKAHRILLSEDECRFIEYLIAEKYIPSLSTFKTIDEFRLSLKEITRNSAACAKMPKEVLGLLEIFLWNHSSSDCSNKLNSAFHFSLSLTSSVEGPHDEGAFEFRSSSIELSYALQLQKKLESGP